ncbi:ATP-binding protein [archaeon]|nr:MAG: ATP-binding protein [archaeon]RLG64417.1 MAG: ATP-binding protein [archaeon]RLG64734.1 MAG: ATP-binding protein [archaeon]HDM23681.1 ATP-binding protein [Candidatus Bathyarchaeota archaeon]
MEKKLDNSRAEKLRKWYELEKQIKERMKNIKFKIAVMSGKGGVGKSFVTANLAIALSLRGFKVGVLDADIHGPSIPRLLGVHTKGLTADEKGIKPAISNHGIKIISIDFLLPSGESPVVWRGPLKTAAIRQFLGQVDWGELDFLLIDLPPGTGDEPLTIAQSIPDMTAVIMVTIPSELSQDVVKKAITFARAVKVPLLGIIENMSYFTCPKCGERHYIFGKGGGESLSKATGVTMLGSIPLDPEASEMADKGLSFLTEMKESEIAKEFNKIVDKVLEKIKA